MEHWLCQSQGVKVIFFHPILLSIDHVKSKLIFFVYKNKQLLDALTEKKMYEAEN